VSTATAINLPSRRMVERAREGECFVGNCWRPCATRWAKNPYVLWLLCVKGVLCVFVLRRVMPYSVPLPPRPRLPPTDALPTHLWLWLSCLRPRFGLVWSPDSPFSLHNSNKPNPTKRKRFALVVLTPNRTHVRRRHSHWSETRRQLQSVRNHPSGVSGCDGCPGR